MDKWIERILFCSAALFLLTVTGVVIAASFGLL